MWLLAEERDRRRKRDAALADETRAAVRTALARHVPGTPVWVYGSLVTGIGKISTGEAIKVTAGKPSSGQVSTFNLCQSLLGIGLPLATFGAQDWSCQQRLSERGSWGVGVGCSCLDGAGPLPMRHLQQPPRSGDEHANFFKKIDFKAFAVS
jgi:hypothetical protein